MTKLTKNIKEAVEQHRSCKCRAEAKLHETEVVIETKKQIKFASIWLPNELKIDRGY